MKLAYLVVDLPDIKENYPGFIKKIRDQMSAFERAGIHADLLSVELKKGLKYKIRRRFPFLRGGGVEWKKLDVSSYDVIYIRRSFIVNRDMVEFLREIKKAKPCTTILWEIPTYPYDRESVKAASVTTIPLILADRYYRRQFKNYFDRIVDMSGTAEIFGIPTLEIVNGIDLEKVSKRVPAIIGPDNTYNFLAVAAFSEWHGIDRLIEGLNCYFQEGGSSDITLHLAGNGPAIPSLRALVDKYNLSERVVFHGMCHGSELDELYNMCSLAVASLGLHRIGLSLASTLKTREYLAKGIPFVYSGRIDVFEENPVEFCLQVPDDESMINIPDLIEFCDSIYGEGPEDDLISIIREYATQNVNIDKAMAEVIDYIKETHGEKRGNS